MFCRIVLHFYTNRNHMKSQLRGKVERRAAVMVMEGGVGAVRVLVPTRRHLGDANVQLRHAAEKGAWVWHPERGLRETAVLRFRLRLELVEPLHTVVHVTADQRFQLRCNGQDLTYGPDRCDVAHWTVHSLQLELAPGVHDLEALVWFIADPAAGQEPGAKSPMAQMSLHAGFLLFAEGVDAGVMNTGTAPWRVEDLTQWVGMKQAALPFYHVAGPSFQFDLAGWGVGEGKATQVVLAALVENLHGVHLPGWWLHGADLPELKRER